MPEQTFNPHAQFEDFINELLTGDTQKNALNFVRHLIVECAKKLMEMKKCVVENGGRERVKLIII